MRKKPDDACFAPTGDGRGTRETRVRRKRAFAFFFAVALAGTILRAMAPPQSDFALLGSVLLVAWVPVATYAISWLVRRWRSPWQRSARYANDGEFVPELAAEVTFDWPPRNDGRHPIPGREYPCIVAIGTDGFSARFVVPAGVPNAGDAAQRVEFEFLAPAVALPRLLPGTRIRVLEGNDVRGEGRVVALIR